MIVFPLNGLTLTTSHFEPYNTISDRYALTSSISYKIISIKIHTSRGKLFLT